MSSTNARGGRYRGNDGDGRRQRTPRHAFHGGALTRPAPHAGLPLLPRLHARQHISSR